MRFRRFLHRLRIRGMGQLAVLCPARARGSVCFLCSQERRPGYVLDEDGLTMSSRWGTQRRVRWSNVSRIKYFERGMMLGLLLKDGSRLPIRCGALQKPEVFRKEAQRLATVTGSRGHDIQSIESPI